ncbi:UTP--glucose-1-phosphate uridylyltransferase [Salmo trutta]|uniref:UTP--glucose-1-phosphate uridylyltransferase n=1 Tax=Salmo trutta TaxID=8032 RepID=UPI001130173D|nr:UTP--glucose-1-phosphate uridylyltransferase-like [Salmo trutta]
MACYFEGLSKGVPNGGMAQFQEVMRQQLETSMHAELEKLLDTATGVDKEVSRKDFDGFKKLFHRFLQVKGPSVDWPKIHRPPEDSIQPYDKIAARPLPDSLADSLNKLVVVKLNGGLGTSMGCKGPKSLISVRNENTFLDLTVQQIEVPRINKESLLSSVPGTPVLIKSPSRPPVLCPRYPRINKESLLSSVLCPRYPRINKESLCPRYPRINKESLCPRYPRINKESLCPRYPRINKESLCPRYPRINKESLLSSVPGTPVLIKSPSCPLSQRVPPVLCPRYPRINKESLLPVATDIGMTGENADVWYPPGHGDIYASFYNSGLLDQLITEGKEYIFVSNIDNLGATVDLNILHHLVSQPNGKRCEFIMEVTDKTRADVKGGTLIQYDNKLRLLEIAQVPKAHVDEFKSVTKFKIFNTNNLWISLGAIKRLQEQNAMDMEIIVNPKTLDGGQNVIQLETAVGAAIKSFDNALGINVPRSRFLPVKTVSDLLLVMSNLYSLEAGSLTMSQKREFPTTPHVKLGSSFTKVQEYQTRFESIPDMLELDHLTVSGDVTFGKQVSLKGTVIIIANHGDRIDIPAGTILENKIVSGNLRILDH